MAKIKINEKYVFCECNLVVTPCEKCVFGDAPVEVCEEHPCRDWEREDGKDGYFRAANVTKLSYPYPKGGTQ